MANQENGADYYYVDHVEQIMESPASRHYTRAELRVSSRCHQEVTEAVSESFETTTTTFRETAYLAGLQGHSAGSEKSASESESGQSQEGDPGLEVSVDTSTTKETKSQSSEEQSEYIYKETEEFSERYIDRTEQELDEDETSGLKSPTITVTKETKLSMMRTRQKSSEHKSDNSIITRLDFSTFGSSGVGASSTDGDDYSHTETEVQPFMEVDPNDIIGYNDDERDKSSVLDEFLMMRQKRETFGQEEQSSQFERVLEDQSRVQKEKDRREQAIMDKLLGTFPAYRADWEQKSSVGPQAGKIGTAATETIQTTSSETVFHSMGGLSASERLSRDVEAGSTAASEQQTSDISEIPPSQELQQRTLLTEASWSSVSRQENVWNSSTQSERSMPGIQVEQSTENLESTDTSSELTMSMKEMQEAVLTRGSVTEPSSIIEIERKFILTDNSETKLKDLGGVLLSEKSFKDTYYDTLSYKLTLSDLWLRQRGSQWQLKAPVADRVLETTSTQYHELIDEREIVRIVSGLLGLDSSMSLVGLSELVHIGLLSEFCSYTTTRRSYGLENCTVDLDLTSFGFRVGEIEMVVVEGSRIPEALTAIDKVAALLELQPYASADLTVF